VSTIRSGELLRLLSEHDGAYLLDELGALHRDDLKLRTITVKAANGRDMFVLPGEGGTHILDDFIRASLVYQAVPLDDKYRRVYRLTPDGVVRGRVST
jgi:hypothetical protein